MTHEGKARIDLLIPDLALRQRCEDTLREYYRLFDATYRNAYLCRKHWKQALEGIWVFYDLPQLEETDADLLWDFISSS